MRGATATEFVDFDRRIDVVVRYPTDLRYSRETLDALRVEGIPIRELVRITESVGPTQVRREDQARVVPVYADVVDGGLDGAILEITPLRPLTATAGSVDPDTGAPLPSTGYLILVTDGVQDTDGMSASPDADYQCGCPVLARTEFQMSLPRSMRTSSRTTVGIGTW